MRSIKVRVSCACGHDIAPCDAQVRPSAVNPIPMILLRLPVGSSATPAAWPCGAADLRDTYGHPGASEHSPFGRHSTAPRLSGSPTIAASFARRANWLRCRDTPNAIHAHILGTHNRPGGAITCSAKLLWLSHALRRPEVVPHSTTLRTT